MTVQARHIARPDLNLPHHEAEALRLAYQEASVILEYGSGGSTILASKMPGKNVVSVESDWNWAESIKDWLATNPTANGTSVEILWTDIGPTENWGHPVSDEGWRNYSSYPLGVWSRKGFIHPDVVFVDGRFRVGCALATAFNITRPVTLLFDDYTNRKWMQKTEEFLGQPEIIGRLGVFEVHPIKIPANRMMQIIRYMTMP